MLKLVVWDQKQEVLIVDES